MTLSTVSSELQIFLQPNLFWWYFIISWVSCEKIGLLCSCPGPQQRFKVPMNICPANIFWISEPFLIKLLMVMHHHEPVSCEKLDVLTSRSKAEWGLILSKFIFWMADPFATKLNLMVHYNKLGCPVFVRKLDCGVQGQGLSGGSKYQCMFVSAFSSEPFVTKFVIGRHHYELECCIKRFVCCLQGQCHNEDSYN